MTMAPAERYRLSDAQNRGDGCRRCGCWHIVGGRCRHCGHARTAAPLKVADPVEDGVEYPILYCPFCGSDENKVTSTQRPVRYHKCLNAECGKSFKSVEPTRR